MDIEREISMHLTAYSITAYRKCAESKHEHEKLISTHHEIRTMYLHVHGGEHMV